MIIKYANEAALETLGLKPDEYINCLGSVDPESGKWKLPDEPANVLSILQLPYEMKGDKKYESGYKKKIIKNMNNNHTFNRCSLVLIMIRQ